MKPAGQKKETDVRLTVRTHTQTHTHTHRTHAHTNTRYARQAHHTGYNSRPLYLCSMVVKDSRANHSFPTLTRYC